MRRAGRRWAGGRGRLPGTLAILALTIACYWPALRGGFIWDDDRHVSENRTLRDLSGLGRIWFRWGSTPQYYPLTHTSFWLEYRLWGQDTTGYHITNILLHAVNALLIWRLLGRLEVPGAWAAAAIFVVHPVNVESVAWISERKNVLAMLFALLAAIAYLRFALEELWPNWGLYAGSLALFLAALLSKTVSATVPAVLLVLIWWKRGRIGGRDLLRLSPFFAAGIGMGLMTALMERNYVGASGPDWALSLADRIIIAGRAVWFYAGKLVWPWPLMFSYPRWDIRAGDWAEYLAPVGVLALVALLVLGRKRIGRGAVAAVLIDIGTLFAALGFFNTYPMRYSFVADHFQYLSDPALIALAVAAVAGARKNILVARAALAAVLVGLCRLSWVRAHAFAGPEQIWRDTIAKNPASWMAQHNLAVTLSNFADVDRAAGDERAARRHLLEALDLFAQTKALRPQHEKVEINWADALAKLGRYDEALAKYRAELKRDPANLGLHGRIAATLAASGEVDAAVAEYQQLLAINPADRTAELSLGELLYRVGRPEEAAPHLEEYLRRRPDDAATQSLLGYVYGELARFDDARRQFERALELDPDLATAQRGLSLLRQARRGPASTPAARP